MSERVCIFGSRGKPDTKGGYPSAPVIEYVNNLPPDTILINGCAPGVDSVALAAAEARGLKVEKYPADFEAYGPSAGPRRNAVMVKRADRGVGFRAPGRSPGTDSCEKLFRKAGKPVEVRR